MRLLPREQQHPRSKQACAQGSPLFSHLPQARHLQRNQPQWVGLLWTLILWGSARHLPKCSDSGSVSASASSSNTVDAL